MQLSGRFEEHLTDAVGLFRIVADLRSNLAFEHVGDGNARMAMRGRALARTVGDLDDRHRPALHVDIWQVVLEDRLGRAAATALRAHHRACVAAGVR